MPEAADRVLQALAERYWQFLRHEFPLGALLSGQPNDDPTMFREAPAVGAAYRSFEMNQAWAVPELTARSSRMRSAISNGANCWASGTCSGRYQPASCCRFSTARHLPSKTTGTLSADARPKERISA